MGDFGHLLFELALALAALHVGGSFCGLCHLRVFSLAATVDEPGRDCLVPRRGCVVDRDSSLT